MASAQVCPVVGTTTTVLPPDHPSYDPNDTEARCPVTNAKVAPPLPSPTNQTTPD